jgi:hydroxyethylthiazole kinase-like uncharacterized protein yjeF
MQKVFDEVNTLDSRCYKEYGLSEDILMENASSAIKEYIVSNFPKDKTILIVAGSGNNGADGIALARMLHNMYDIKLFIPLELKSDMAKLQLKRAKSIGVHIVGDICSCDIVVDALFGSGLTRELRDNIVYIVERMSELKAYKIACDIPTGILHNGIVSPIAFRADTTITMGALKKSLFLDQAKDYVGTIIVADLGVSKDVYESSSNCYMLEPSDISLPHRVSQDTHKGTFGHLATYVGNKEGAGVITAISGFAFGVGLSSIVCENRVSNLPYEIMQDDQLPTNTTAIAIGMGLGDYLDTASLKEVLSHNIGYVIDADMFYKKEILQTLHKPIVLTPHPKEFVSLLAISSTVHIDIKTLQDNRFEYLELFSRKYPQVVILLKGSNTLIAHDGVIYINPLGSSRLSFGGSGDVLAGLIGSLLAQRYEPLEATITASLAHALAVEDGLNSYAYTPTALIESIKRLDF